MFSVLCGLFEENVVSISSWKDEILSSLWSLAKTSPRTVKLVANRIGKLRCVFYPIIVVGLTIMPLLTFMVIGDIADKLGKVPFDPASLDGLGLKIGLVVIGSSIVALYHNSLGQRIREALWFTAVVRGSEAMAGIEEHNASPEVRDKVVRVREHARWRMGNFADGLAMLLFNIVGAVLTAILAFDLGKWIPALLLAGIPQLLGELTYARDRRRMDLKMSRFWQKFWTTHWNGLHPDNARETQLYRNELRFSRRLEWYAERLRKPLEALIKKYDLVKLATLLPIGIVLALACSDLINQAIESKINKTDAMTVGHVIFLIGGLVSFSGALGRISSNLHQLSCDGLLIGDFYYVIDLVGVKLFGLWRFTPRNDDEVNPPGFGRDELPMKRFEECPTLEVNQAGYHRPVQGKDAELHWILQDVTFRVKPGEKVLIVGESGAGKTTLLDCLVDRKRLVSGQILINGKLVSEVQESWRDSAGILSQNFFKMEAHTVRECLTWATRQAVEDFSDEELLDALASAEALDFVEGKTNGLDAYLIDHVDRGDESHLSEKEREEVWEGLSTGEWQRLRLAALFLRSPWVFLLDEPTSAIDSTKGLRIVRRLLALKEKSVVMVTHHMSLCPHADRILVLSKESTGIAEDGTHEELLAEGGVYAKLYNDYLHGGSEEDDEVSQEKIAV